MEKFFKEHLLTKTVIKDCKCGSSGRTPEFKLWFHQKKKNNKKKKMAINLNKGQVTEKDLEGS
jgi:hypothetical protein